MAAMTCTACERDFASEVALLAHSETVHAKKIEKASAAAAGHKCEPCARTFTQERALFQHATALHGYDEAADRAALARVPVPYLLGTAPWEQGERRIVISIDRETGTRVLKDYETQYKQTDEASAVTHAAHQSNSHGSASSVSGLSCSACDRAFLSVRGLRDHAEAVHQDQALEATYDERRELVSNAIRTHLNPGLTYTRTYAWVSDMTDEFVVFQVEGEEHYRKASYTIAEDGVVTIGEGVHVRRRAVYETVGSA